MDLKCFTKAPTLLLHIPKETIYVLSFLNAAVYMYYIIQIKVRYVRLGWAGSMQVLACTGMHTIKSITLWLGNSVGFF